MITQPPTERYNLKNLAELSDEVYERSLTFPLAARRLLIEAVTYAWFQGEGVFDSAPAIVFAERFGSEPALQENGKRGAAVLQGNLDEGSFRDLIMAYDKVLIDGPEAVKEAIFKYKAPVLKEADDIRAALETI